MKKVYHKLKALVLKVKKWMVAKEHIEYVLHHIITYMLVVMGTIPFAVSHNFWMSPLLMVAGVLLNFVVEWFPPPFNMKDILAGGSGGIHGWLTVLAILLICNWFGLYTF